MTTQIQRRRGTTAQHSTFTGAEAELTVDTTKDTVVVHDGSTVGGRPLLREDQSNLPTTAPTTGIYNASGSLAISTGGSGRLFVDASGNVTVNGGGQITSRNVGASPGLGRIQLGESGAWTVEGLDTGYGGSGAYLKISSGTSERLRITSAGLVGVGTSSPSYTIDVNGTARFNGSTVINGSSLDINPSSGQPNITLRSGNTFRGYIEGNSSGGLTFGSGPSATTAMTIDSSQRVGIGTTSPGELLHVYNSAATSRLIVGPSGTGAATPNALALEQENTGYTVCHVRNIYNNAGLGELRLGGYGFTTFTSGSSQTERARIDSSGRLLVGTSSLTSTYFTNISSSFQIQATGNYTGANIIANNNNNIYGSYLTLGKSRGATTGSFTIVSNGDSLGGISFEGADGSAYKGAALIECSVDGTPGANDMPGRLVFSTTADGAYYPTERMRISRAGDVNIGKTAYTSVATNGHTFEAGGLAHHSISSQAPLWLNRNVDDGNLVNFYQDGTIEGNISVSGTTVSYNGAHLSRWSQLPSGAERTEILRGSILSNIDEMCEWGDENNEQLNRMKVSDIEGDTNVAGVFQAWDDDDDTYTNDFYCAMTGDFIIRIGAGVVVQRGDLLMSAGDGTAKPQGDDIVRSKTVAKVTSTNVSCTYEDGSYCVPCVLMAC